jgi:phosphatidylglycerophosphate synthase
VIEKLYLVLLTPIARRLGGVSPNAVTLVSLTIGLAAGACFSLTGRDARLYLVAAGLVALSGIADSLDGLMARMHDRRTTLGDFLDHFLDRIVDVAVLVGLALTPHATTAFGLAVTLVVVLNAYLGTQIEATFQRRFYSGLGKAELFVGLVVGSIVLGVFPDAALPVAGRRFPLVDLFFLAVGLLALQAIAHRFRLALRLAREAGSDAGGGPK